MFPWFISPALTLYHRGQKAPTYVSDFVNEGLRGCPSFLVIRGCCAIYSWRTESQQKPQWPQIIKYVVSLYVKQIAHFCPKHCFQVLFLFWHTGSIDYSSHQDKLMKMFARLCQHRVPKGRENRCFITSEISHFFSNTASTIICPIFVQNFECFLLTSLCHKLSLMFLVNIILWLFLCSDLDRLSSRAEIKFQLRNKRAETAMTTTVVFRGWTFVYVYDEQQIRSSQRASSMTACCWRTWSEETTMCAVCHLFPCGALCHLRTVRPSPDTGS